MNIPDKPSENIAAVSAEEKSGEDITPAVDALSASVSEQVCSSYHFLLDSSEGFLADDGFVIVSHIILRSIDLILSALFLKRVVGPCFLKKRISDVFLVC